MGYVVAAQSLAWILGNPLIEKAASADLNATLLAWPPGEGTPDHVNADRDVLVGAVAPAARGVDDEAVPRAGPGGELDKPAVR